MRVLVVEDDKALREQLETALTNAGYAVDAADNGEDGQFQGETEPYDVILLDLGLPKIDGLTVLKSWRAGGVTTPVLSLSARDRWSEKVEGLDMGANDYVTKPFNINEVLARVRAHVRRRTDHASAVLEVGDLQLNSATAQEGTLINRVDFRGLKTTFGRALEGHHVIQYPEEKTPVYPRFRGRHKLHRFEDTGLEKCVGCSLCAAACPAKCIRVVAAENTPDNQVSAGERYAAVYEINMTRCIFCGYCEMACPFDAITMGNDYELADYSRSDLIFTKEMLLADPPEHTPLRREGE